MRGIFEQLVSSEIEEEALEEEKFFLDRVKDAGDADFKEL